MIEYMTKRSGGHVLFPKKLHASRCQRFSILIISILFLCQLLSALPNLQAITSANLTPITTMVNQSVQLAPGEYHYLHFNTQINKLHSYQQNPLTDGFSLHISDAIVKTPEWLQPMLTTQFHHLSDPEPYADLILNSSRQYADEIAFIIAASSIGKVPSVSVIQKNVEALYRNDAYVAYADIIDISDMDNNYYSTIVYKTLEEGIPHEHVLPRDLYYWYIVHPEILSENAEEIYGEIWRDYLVHHNDIGYPLLKEKIHGIQYLWDGEAYHQPGERLWNQSISIHPTAIEAIGYWIGKTVPYGATGSRPGQPQKIAHEHNGWCGELQRIAVAAQRALLIPSVGACNVAEDHVWREFYEQGWHQNDNWWYDGGGAVDIPDVYAYGWGKNMSSIYGWRGDDAIYEVTSRYIHQEDRVTLTFNVRDTFLTPIDGARVTALVTGIKDITWYKMQIWDAIQQIWDRIPTFLKGRILQQIFNRIETRFAEIPDVIDGVTISVWNYTDATGTCSLTVGKNLEYVFIIQSGNLRKAWQFARHNTIRFLKEPTNKTYNIIFADITHRPRRHLVINIPKGDNNFYVKFNSTATQFHSNLQYDDIGRNTMNGFIEVFLVDKANLALFQQGKFFRCYKYLAASNAELDFQNNLSEWYLIFFNPTRDTTMSLYYNAYGTIQDVDTYIDIVTPFTTIFSEPQFGIGEQITISGIASDDVTLLIENETCQLSCIDGRWSYQWITDRLAPGMYVIEGHCQGISDRISIQLIDINPPNIQITSPSENSILDEDILLVEGICYDTYEVAKIQISIDDAAPFDILFEEGNWQTTLDISTLPLGDHMLTAHAYDSRGLYANHSIYFIVNESGHTWGPQLNKVYHQPTVNITNVSNVIIYANVTKGNPFSISHCILTLIDSNGISEYPMYRYGDFPPQKRHLEDPLINVSNTPIYGIELAQLPPDSYTYFIHCFDTANNQKKSENYSFIVNEAITFP